jgi:hypothetical protein
VGLLARDGREVILEDLLRKIICVCTKRSSRSDVKRLCKEPKAEERPSSDPGNSG